MHDDEHHAEIAADPLERVPPVLLLRIASDVGPSAEREVHAEHGMENDGEEQQPPLQKNQSGKIVDKIDFVLEGLDPGVTVVGRVEPISPDDRRVRGQMHQ